MDKIFRQATPSMYVFHSFTGQESSREWLTSRFPWLVQTSLDIYCLPQPPPLLLKVRAMPVWVIKTRVTLVNVRTESCWLKKKKKTSQTGRWTDTTTSNVMEKMNTNIHFLFIHMSSEVKTPFIHFRGVFRLFVIYLLDNSFNFVCVAVTPQPHVLKQGFTLLFNKIKTHWDQKATTQHTVC